ncbi:MAG: hypothetical protein HW416_2431 [Chloroflexi bacterium]|nr:hypothetical protein [Chloroflexota bacterium]
MGAAVKDLIAKHVASVRTVIDANLDLQERLASLSLCVVHDREDDLFTLTIGEPQEAVTESVRNRLYFRVDPDTLKIVGIEIPHVSARLNDDPLLEGFLRRFLPLAGPEQTPAIEAARELRELVKA